MANTKSSAQLKIGDNDWARAKIAEGCKDPNVSDILAKDKAKEEKSIFGGIVGANGNTPRKIRTHP